MKKAFLLLNVTGGYAWFTWFNTALLYDAISQYLSGIYSLFRDLIVYDDVLFQKNVSLDKQS